MEGVEEFKKRVWQCMHLSSGMEEEEGVWTELVRKLREVSSVLFYCCGEKSEFILE